MKGSIIFDEIVEFGEKCGIVCREQVTENNEQREEMAAVH
jgi:hypothetical protein